MLDTVISFFVVGSILFIGFFMQKLFRRTGIPDSVFLILIGIILGPIAGLVDTALFLSLVPLFAPLALAIILFEGGMSSDITKMLKGMSHAASFTISAFILSIAFISLAASLVFGWDPLQCILLGAVLGGTTAASTMGLLKYIKAPSQTKTTLNLEAALTDALVIVVALLVAGIIQTGSLDPGSIGATLAASFSTAVVAGIIAGLGWLPFVDRIGGREFESVLTFAFILLLYAAVQALGSNGVIAVFVFGLVLSNRKLITLLKQSPSVVLESRIEHFIKEISFFVRTFFFVYVGLLLNPNLLTPLIAIGTVAVIIAVLIARSIVAQIFFFNRERMLAATMMPKGLAAAVLATYPQLIGLQIFGFAETVILAIILSNIVAAVGVFFYNRKANGNCNVGKQAVGSRTK